MTIISEIHVMNLLRKEFSDIYESDIKGMTKEEADAYLDEEVTAELVGRYLFDEDNAEDFIRQLAREDRSAFEKIYDSTRSEAPTSSLDWSERRRQQTPGASAPEIISGGL